MADRIVNAIMNLNFTVDSEAKLQHLKKLANFNTEEAVLAELRRMPFNLNPPIADAEVLGQAQAVADIKNTAAYLYIRARIQAVSPEMASAKEALHHIASDPVDPALSIQARFHDAQRYLVPRYPEDTLTNPDVLRAQDFAELRHTAAEKYVGLLFKSLPEVTLLHLMEALLKAKTSSEFRAALAQNEHGVPEWKFRFGDIKSTDILDVPACNELRRIAKAKMHSEHPNLLWRTRYEDYGANSPDAAVRQLSFESYELGQIEEKEFKEIIVPALVRKIGGKVDTAQLRVDSTNTNAQGKVIEHSVELPGNIKVSEKWTAKNSLQLNLTTGTEGNLPRLFDILANLVFAHFVTIIGMDLDRFELNITDMPTLKDRNDQVISWTAEHTKAFKKALANAGFQHVKLPVATALNVGVRMADRNVPDAAAPALDAPAAAAAPAPVAAAPAAAPAPAAAAAPAPTAPKGKEEQESSEEENSVLRQAPRIQVVSEEEGPEDFDQESERAEEEPKDNTPLMRS